jgi:polysaccharide biosynthesis transport protein
MNGYEQTLIGPGGNAPSGMAGGESSRGPDVLRLFRRHLHLVLITAAIVMGGACLALLVLPPRYDATTVMRVDVDEPQPLGPQATPASIREAELQREHQIATQIQALSSRAVARQTVRDLALYDDREFNPDADADKQEPGLWQRLFGAAPAAPAVRPKARPAPAVTPQVVERTTDRLLQAIKVEQDGQSSFVNVTVSSRYPGKAARIANKVAKTYVAIEVNERRAGRNRTVNALSRRVAELQQQLVSTERSIAFYRASHGLETEAGAGAESAAMARLASEFAASRGSTAEAAARSGGSGHVMSPLLADLRNQQTVVGRRLAELGTIYGGAHPDVLKANAELDQIRSAIAAETARAQSQMANEAGAQRAREGQLAADLGAMRARSLAQGSAMVPLADLERDAETTRTVYMNFLSRLKELRRGDETVRADASIASAALLPTQPSFPRPGQILGTAAGAAVLIALLVVVVAELLDNQVRTAAQVYGLTGLATFGMIPEISRRRRGWLAHVTVATRPYSLFADAVRTVEARLTRHLVRKSGNVVVITSPLPGDGKTTVAIGLAAAAVATGQSAVLLELDLRRPGFPDFLVGEEEGKDLLDYLDGNADLDEVLVPSQSLPDLKAIPVRQPASDPGAILASPRLNDLLQQLRERFDLVLINTPPALAVGDAQSLASRADAVLLVLRWGRTTPDLLCATVAQFEVNITAAVFNRVRYAAHARMSRGDRLQHYHKFADYHRSDEPSTSWVADRRLRSDALDA